MLSTDTINKLREMRIYGWIDSWERYLERGKDPKCSLESIITEMIDDEFSRKKEIALKRRINKAKVEEEWCIETYPFKLQPKFSPRKLMACYDSLEYMKKCKNLVWVGPTGCGKTGLAISFLLHAIRQGHTGRFVTFNELINELFQSAADHSEQNVLKSYLRCDCLVIDEIGYIEVEPAQVGLFFELLHRRHKKAPTLITTNLGFNEWSGFLKNDHLTAALVDRLTENCYVFNMNGCKSLRHADSS